VIHGEVEDEPVEELGGDARAHVLDQEVERLGRQAAGAAHALEGFGPVKRGLRGAAAVEGGLVLRHPAVRSPVECRQAAPRRKRAGCGPRAMLP
jgi:hypothetical protein